MADASGLAFPIPERGFPLYERRAYLGANERLRQPTAYSDLSAERLTAVLMQLQRGEVDKWADLVQYALKDDLLTGLYSTRVTRVAQADYQVVPNEFGDPALAQQAADFIHETIGRIENWDQFLRNMLHAIALGYSANEIEWDRDGVSRTTFPRNIHYINPNRFRYDEQWKLRLYDHGTRCQSSKSQYGEPLWPGTWVVHQHFEIAGDPCDAGLMRSSIWRWLFRRWADTFWITTLEKYGSPWVTAKVTPNTPEAVRQKIKENLIDLNIERAAVIEMGGELVITPPAMGTGTASQHELYMDHAMRSLTTTWLGASDVTQPGENGSQAAVGGRIGATTDPKMVTDGMNLCGSLHAQLFKWMLVYNRHLFGGQMPPVPKMQFKTASDEQTTDQQDLAQQNAQDMQQPGGAPPTPYQVRGDAGSPSLDGSLPQPTAASDPHAAPSGYDQIAANLQAESSSISLEGAAPPATSYDIAPPPPIPPPEPAKLPKKADTAYSSGQIDSILKIIRAVMNGEIPRSSAVGLISHGFGIDATAADAIVADAMAVAPPPQPDAFDPYGAQPDPLVDPQQPPPLDASVPKAWSRSPQERPTASGSSQSPTKRSPPKTSRTSLRSIGPLETVLRRMSVDPDR